MQYNIPMDTLKLSKACDIPDAQEAPVDNLITLYRTCLQMERVCLENAGIGLAAVQVGVPWKLFVVRRPDEEFDYFVNCEYTPEGEEKGDSIEGCLSLSTEAGDMRLFRVRRYKKVRIKGTKLEVKGKPELVPVDFVESDELYTIVYQHEIEHARGILISDIGKEIELKHAPK